MISGCGASGPPFGARPLLFDWQPDGNGTAIRRVLEGRDGLGAWPSVVAAAPTAARTTPRSSRLSFGARSLAADGTRRTLLVHRSASLVQVLKALNCYSNNVFHPSRAHRWTARGRAYRTRERAPRGPLADRHRQRRRRR
jgi:hypothetical protein